MLEGVWGWLSRAPNLCNARGVMRPMSTMRCEGGLVGLKTTKSALHITKRPLTSHILLYESLYIISARLVFVEFPKMSIVSYLYFFSK